MSDIELFELWEAVDDKLERMQAITSGNNLFVQEVEMIKKKLADSVTEVMEGPEWNYNIPVDGEPSPNPELNEVMKDDR